MYLYSFDLVGDTKTLLYTFSYSIRSSALSKYAARLPTATTSLIMLSEVLFATISAWLLGATELTPRMLLGGALIIGGALLAALQGRRRKA
jgi:drug/metabolite transporter (DMT)-like permease